MWVSEPIETLALRTTALLSGPKHDKKPLQLAGGKLAMLQFIFPKLPAAPQLPINHVLLSCNAYFLYLVTLIHRDPVYIPITFSSITSLTVLVCQPPYHTKHHTPSR